MVTNTELIRRDLAATNHDIVLRIEKPLAKRWKVRDETAEEAEEDPEAQARTGTREEGDEHSRGHIRGDRGLYPAIGAGGKAAK